MKKIALLIVFLIIACFSVYYIGKAHKNSGSFISRHATRFFDYSNFRIQSRLKNFDINSIVIQQQPNRIIYRNGEKDSRMLNKYGTCCLVFWSNDKVLSEVCFFRKNNWHINDYYITIDTLDNIPFAFVDILGPDSVENVTYKKYTHLEDSIQVKYIDENSKVFHIDTISNNSLLLPVKFP